MNTQLEKTQSLTAAEAEAAIKSQAAMDAKTKSAIESYLSIRAVVGLSDYDTKSIVQAIADGMITNITFNY